MDLGPVIDELELLLALSKRAIAAINVQTVAEIGHGSFTATAIST